MQAKKSVNRLRKTVCLDSYVIFYLLHKEKQYIKLERDDSLNTDTSTVKATKKARGTRHVKKIFFKNYQLYLFALPAIVATFIFSYIPMYGVQIAFRNFRIRDGFWGSQWVGLAHFRRLFEFPLLWDMVLDNCVLQNILAVS